MPLELSCNPVLGQGVWTATAEPGRMLRPASLRAAAERFFTFEEADGATLPPAGASRAETVFTTVGIVLLLAIGLSALWILLRGRL